MVVAIAVKIQACFRIHEILRALNDIGNEAHALIGNQGVRPTRNAWREVISLLATHLVIVDRDIRAPFVPLLHPGSWFRLGCRDPLSIQVKSVMIRAQVA